VSAILAVRNGEVDLKTAAKLHNIPRSALQRYLDDDSLNPKEAVIAALGRRTVLSREI
jgi:hypothetical protein